MRLLRLLAATCIAVLASAASGRAAYPTHTITLVVPYAPGGATDIVARVLAEEMHKDLGQTVLVENKPGAFGILAIQDVARSKPDGYTLMVGNVSTNAITPIIYASRMGVNYQETILPRRSR